MYEITLSSSKLYFFFFCYYYLFVKVIYIYVFICMYIYVYIYLIHIPIFEWEITFITFLLSVFFSLKRVPSETLIGNYFSSENLLCEETFSQLNLFLLNVVAVFIFNFNKNSN